MESLADRLAWRDELGALIVENDTVLIETAVDGRSPLAQAWSRLKRHRNLIAKFSDGAATLSSSVLTDLQRRPAIATAKEQRHRARRAQAAET